MSLVTLEEVKRQLRLESTIDDALITHKIGVAEEIVQGFVGPFDEFADGVPAVVKEAVILTVEHQFDALSDAKARAEELLLPYRRRVF